MADRRELIKYLRFQLNELSAENGHHIFEHICREVARARLATNLLPATGPVAGGGDAGRDFETFKSYLPKELGEHSAFVASSSDRPLAFACTLQREKVDRKFKRDVDAIAASGDEFEHVYAMCVANVDVGRRNRLRNKVRDQHGLALTLLDGQWLAEQLADADLFWVAESYLSVPAHMAPPPPTEIGGGQPEWYVADLAKWRQRGELRPTLGDLLDAKVGLRYATFNEEGRPDLHFWLDLVHPLTAPECPRDVRQRARYEYAVATLRGIGELRPADDVVRAFFVDALPDDEMARLKDASILLNYAVGAYGRNLTELNAEYLRGINEKLRSHLHDFLDVGPYPTRRAMALEVLGHLAVLPDPTCFSPAKEPQPVDIAEYVDEDGDVKMPSSAPAPADFPYTDIEEAMAAWGELASSIDQAPLFPVEELSRFLNVLAPVLVDYTGWRELIDTVDAAVRRSAGNAAAGSSARTRAMRLLEAGRQRDALSELHSAKVDWWSGDNFEGALLAMLLISDIYRRLGMAQASKQYALAVAVGSIATGDDGLRRFMPRGLLAAAHADYFSGAWCNALDLWELAFLAIHQLSDTLELDDDHVRPALYNFASLLRTTEALAPDLRAGIEAAMQRCGMEELVELSAEIPTMTPDEIVAAADMEMNGRPYSDAGAERVIRFAALGLDWTVRSDNRYEHVLVAERFAAAAQVLLVELANKDLCFLRTTIDVAVKPTPRGVGEARWEACNDGRRWTVMLMAEPDDAPPGRTATPKHETELLAVLTHILLDASLLPFDAYMAQMEEAFRCGLPHKLGVGRPYDDLANAISRERFEAFGRQHAEPPADPAAHPTREHSELAWQSGPGPTYSRETAEEMLQNRYKLFPQNLRFTLPRLLVEPDFRAVIDQLRQEGWKDWHLAVAVFSRTYSLRAEAAGYTSQDFQDPAVMKQLSLLAYEPEDQDWPTPPSTFYTNEALVQSRQFAMLKLVEYWELELRQQTPDLPAIESFLAERYAYWSDDIDHEDPFPQVTSSPTSGRTAQRRTRARRS